MHRIFDKFCVFNCYNFQRAMLLVFSKQSPGTLSNILQYLGQKQEQRTIHPYISILLISENSVIIP